MLFPLLSSPSSCSVCYNVPCQAPHALALRHPSDLLSAPVICSGCPGLFAVSQAASECLSEDFCICSPQRLEAFLQNAPWRSSCPVTPSQAVSDILSAVPALATLTAIPFHAQLLLLPDRVFPCLLLMLHALMPQNPRVRTFVVIFVS